MCLAMVAVKPSIHINTFIIGRAAREVGQTVWSQERFICALERTQLLTDKTMLDHPLSLRPTFTCRTEATISHAWFS